MSHGSNSAIQILAKIFRTLTLSVLTVPTTPWVSATFVWLPGPQAPNEENEESTSGRTARGVLATLSPRSPLPETGRRRCFLKLKRLKGLKLDRSEDWSHWRCGSEVAVFCHSAFLLCLCPSVTRLRILFVFFYVLM